MSKVLARSSALAANHGSRTSLSELASIGGFPSTYRLEINVANGNGNGLVDRFFFGNANPTEVMILQEYHGSNLAT